MNMKGEGGGGVDRNAQYIPLKNLNSTNVNLASMIWENSCTAHVLSPKRLDQMDCRILPSLIYFLAQFERSKLKYVHNMLISLFTF